MTHGSRDPRPHKAVEDLIDLIAHRLFTEPLLFLPGQVCAEPPLRTRQAGTLLCNQLGAIAPPAKPHSPIAAAVLELHPLPLHQQIQQVADRALSLGYSQLQIIPLFLLPGVHVMEDIPSEVRMAQRKVGPSMTLDLRPYLGSHAGLPHLIASSASVPAHAARILIAHGSRRPNGNQPVEAIAAQLGAVAAYWSVSPSLPTQVTHLVEQGYKAIVVQPYFLFAGSITDAIARAIEPLAQQFPAVQFHVMPPLGASGALADLVVDLMDCPALSWYPCNQIEVER